MHKLTFYLFINKEKGTWRTQLHEGTPTMAPTDRCKQAKSDWHQSNLIKNSTTRQDPKSKGFRDLIGDLIGDGIRPGQSYLYGCTGIAWDAMLCMGRMIVEHSSIFYL